jgi:RimJ/RimL family protein N-acetyltransferase
VILGERVRLRRLERTDLPRFVEWLNDPEVRNGLALSYPMSQVHEDEWFEGTLRLEPALQPFAIDAALGVAGPTGGPTTWVLVGSTGFHAVDWKSRWGEVGIVIGRKDLWGHGYGTDALRTLVRWGFRQLNLNRVFLRVDDDNARAIRSYEKIGFVHEGRLRQDRYHAGRYQDTLLMGILRDDLPG